MNVWEFPDEILLEKIKKSSFNCSGRLKIIDNPPYLGIFPFSGNFRKHFANDWEFPEEILLEKIHKSSFNCSSSLKIIHDPP